MPRATTVVTSAVRDRLYELAARSGPKDVYILYDNPWGCEGRLIELDPPTVVYGPPLHFLDIISDRLKPEQHRAHVDTILDERGLRFRRDCDV